MIYNDNNITKKEIISEFIAVKCIKERLKLLLNDKEYLSMKNYIQHGNTNCMLHSIAVTHYSLMFANKLHMKINYRNLVIGALFHDYFLYDWHDSKKMHKWHGFNHPNTALINALKKESLNDVEQDIIKSHMFPLTIFNMPKYKESIIVCLVDKACALYEIFAKKNPYRRMKKLYNI